MLNEKLLYAVVACVLLMFGAEVKGANVVVADSVSHSPLTSVSVFDRNGFFVGVTDMRGCVPYLSPTDYPITLRYLGYKERAVTKAQADTIFMTETSSELPEVVIESRQHKMLHILAYLREYSTLSTYTDTVFMFREKMADFMTLPEAGVKFRGWTRPRILKSKSYYRITNSEGLDSVSDVSNHHFSWSDWIGVNTPIEMPKPLIDAVFATDTIFGRYGPVEIWSKNDDKVSVTVNVLADTVGRRWVPYFGDFFRRNLDFENFLLKFNYANVTDSRVTPADLVGFTYNIETRGRGRDMFHFNHKDEPFFVTTYAEVYIIDKEYITMKEARRWDKLKIASEKFDIIEPYEAPELQPAIKSLIARVNCIDRENIRLSAETDPNIGYEGGNRNFSIPYRALNILKQMTGISSLIHRRKQKSSWRDFRRKQIKENSSRKRSY